MRDRIDTGSSGYEDAPWRNQTRSKKEPEMANDNQPTVGSGDTGAAVEQAQRALRRTPDTTLAVDGIFGPHTETSTKGFQQREGLPVTGIVDGPTWKALPDGNAMPTLKEGYRGDGDHGDPDDVAVGRDPGRAAGGERADDGTDSPDGRPTGVPQLAAQPHRHPARTDEVRDRGEEHAEPDQLEPALPEGTGDRRDGRGGAVPVHPGRYLGQQLAACHPHRGGDRHRGAPQP